MENRSGQSWEWEKKAEFHLLLLKHSFTHFLWWAKTKQPQPIGTLQHHPTYSRTAVTQHLTAKLQNQLLFSP